MELVINMKMNERCLPCLISQVIKVADICQVEDRENLYKKVFQYLSTIDFHKTNPEIIDETFKLLKQHIQNNDPYKNIIVSYYWIKVMNMKQRLIKLMLLVNIQV